MKNTGIFRHLALASFVLLVASPTIYAIQRNNLTKEEVDKVLDAADVLEETLLRGRAPRTDAPQNDNPAQPVSPFDLADLDLIRRCVCIIKGQLRDVCSKLEDLEEQLSIHDNIVCSKLIDLDQDLSAHDNIVCSKLLDLDQDLSAHDNIVCSKLVDLDQDLSAHDQLMCSKIGNLEDTVSCLDSLLDVPDDINDLNLNVIQLLKTILLEIRGCVNP